MVLGRRRLPWLDNLRLGFVYAVVLERSKLDPEGQRAIPSKDQQRLLQHLELGDLPSWSALQRNSGWHRVAIDHWHPQATPDWLWSVGPVSYTHLTLPTTLVV